MLILPKGKNIPECHPNPCTNDGYVNLNGNCFLLGKSGPPCPNNTQYDYELGVEPTKLTIACIITDNRLMNRFGEDDEGATTQQPEQQQQQQQQQQQVTCPLGGKRYVNGQCPNTEENINGTEIVTPSTAIDITSAV